MEDIMIGSNGFDLLGEQLILAIKFQQSGYDPKLMLEDGVRSETHAAENIFELQGERWFMKGESLPGYVGIKAIAIDDTGIYLETSPIDPTKIGKIITEKMLALKYNDKQKKFLDTSKNKVLIQITDAENLEDGQGDRCMWQMDLPQDKVRLNAFVKMADTAYTHEAYQIQEKEMLSMFPPAGTGEQRMAQVLNLSLVQRLDVEQKPILSLKQEQRPDVIMTQTLELRQIQRLELAILNMNLQDLAEFALRDTTPEGQAKTIKVFQFVLAGKLKRTWESGPEKKVMTWKQARQLARSMIGTAPKK